MDVMNKHLHRQCTDITLWIQFVRTEQQHIRTTPAIHIMASCCYMHACRYYNKKQKRKKMSKINTNCKVKYEQNKRNEISLNSHVAQLTRFGSIFPRRNFSFSSFTSLSALHKRNPQRVTVCSTKLSISQSVLLLFINNDGFFFKIFNIATNVQ